MSELAVVEQREVDFYGDQLLAVRGQDNRIYVSLSQVCDVLGVDSRGQRRRFEEAMRWLADWHGEVTGEQSLPF